MSATATTPSDPSAPLASMLTRLRETCAARGDHDSLRLAGEIALAQAAVADLAARRRHPERSLQIALLGPTQVGKSTVANLLLGRVAAEVSPLAGFTIHPQGFAVGAPDGDEWAGAHFEGWQRVSPPELSRERVDQFVLQRQPDARPLVPHAHVIWDTPDFDSLRARSYLPSVFRVAALADLLVLVLSREKYSDLAVWETLQLLAPLQRPLLVCLNKTDPAVADELATALRGRLREFTPLQADAPLVCLPACADLGNLPPDRWPPEVTHLRERVAATARPAAPAARARTTRALLRANWDRWLAPVHAEHAAAAAWRDNLDLAVAEAERTYRRDFLEHPQRFDTFQRAIAELLTLLEVPGVAATLGRVRHVLTWPARQLFSGRTWWGNPQRPHSAGGEEVVLRDVVDRLLLHVQHFAARRVGDPAAAPWWSALHADLETREPDLRAGVATAIESYRAQFTERIQAAADSLYEALRQRPALLNTLRAARTTADAAAVALAVKTAGLGVDALLLAPAMVGVTSMLTEGALGSYMQTVAQRLRDEQIDALRGEVLQPALAAPLRTLPDTLRGPALFGITPDQLQAADAWLAAGDADA